MTRGAFPMTRGRFVKSVSELSEARKSGASPGGGEVGSANSFAAKMMSKRRSTTAKDGSAIVATNHDHGRI